MEPSTTNAATDPVELIDGAPGHLVQNSAERNRHRGEIESIARQLERPQSEVAHLYAVVYTELRSQAIVTDYLPVFVARKVRARLLLRIPQV